MAGAIPAFIANLEAERRTFSDFTELLQTEQDALMRGDVDRLASLAQLKSDKVVTLAKMEDQRNRFLSSAGFTPDQHGMDSWLRAHASESPQAIKLWQELLAQARQAQQLNAANGTIIEQKLSHNQQALSILQSAANLTNTYGPNGQTQPGNRGRPLGKV